VDELLSRLLSAARAVVLKEEIFIAAESLSATSKLPHASMPAVRTLHPLLYIKLIKSVWG